MTVPRSEIERIAQLASLSLEPEFLAELTKQIGDILDYIAQLDAVELEDTGGDFRPGPLQAPLRQDRERVTSLDPSPSQMAPDFESGYFLVPRLPALGDDE